MKAVKSQSPCKVITGLESNTFKLADAVRLMRDLDGVSEEELAADQRAVVDLWLTIEAAKATNIDTDGLLFRDHAVRCKHKACTAKRMAEALEAWKLVVGAGVKVQEKITPIVQKFMAEAMTVSEVYQ